MGRGYGRRRKSGLLCRRWHQPPARPTSRAATRLGRWCSTSAGPVSRPQCSTPAANRNTIGSEWTRPIRARPTSWSPISSTSPRGCHRSSGCQPGSRASCATGRWSRPRTSSPKKGPGSASRRRARSAMGWVRAGRRAQRGARRTGTGGERRRRPRRGRDDRGRVGAGVDLGHRPRIGGVPRRSAGTPPRARPPPGEEGQELQRLRRATSAR